MSRSGEPAKVGERRGRNVVALQEILRECLRAFELRRDARRPENPESRRAEAIDDADFNACKYCPVNHSCRTKHDFAEKYLITRHNEPRTLLGGGAD